MQVDSMVGKSSRRLYMLKCLKRFGLPEEDLVSVFVSYVRPVVEYATQVKSNPRNWRASRNVHVVLYWVPSTTPTQRLLISLDYRHFPTGEFSSVPNLV